MPARGVAPGGLGSGQTWQSVANLISTAVGGSSLRYGYSAIEAAGTWGAVPPYTTYIPTEGWDPVAKTVIAEIINAVGGGNAEEGVYDAPVAVIHPVLDIPPPILTQVPDEDVGPIWGEGWPDEWKKGEPGWNEDEWVYPTTTETPEGSEVAIDWGSVVSGAIDIAQGQTVAQAPGQIFNYSDTVGGGSYSYPAGSAPSKVTVDTKTGKVTACRRRRRRRLLTPTDLNDLAALKTIVGGGQAINFAVMKAVRR